MTNEEIIAKLRELVDAQQKAKAQKCPTCGRCPECGQSPRGLLPPGIPYVPPMRPFATPFWQWGGNSANPYPRAMTIGTVTYSAP